MNIQERDIFHTAGIKQAIVKVEFEEGRVTYSPLHLLIQKNDLSACFRKNQIFSDDLNMRGYLCEWELANKILYLVSFKSSSRVLRKTAQLLQNNTQWMQNLRDQHLLEDKTKCVADWFCGDIFISSDDLKKATQIKVIKYTFENGVLVQSMA
jgi:hypothetical protein